MDSAEPATSTTAPPNPSPTQPPNPTIPPSARISELHSIDTSISALLHSAGTAIQLLGSSSTTHPQISTPSKPTLNSTQTQFLASITTYFTLLSSIDVRLRRQVYALQEAGLIGEGDGRDAKRGGTSGAGVAGGTIGVGGGLGGSGSGSSVTMGGGLVERDVEREVWRRGRDFVERLVQGMEREGDGGSGEV